MKQITAIDQLHRRRLTALEAALKQARAEQADLELLLDHRCRSEDATREKGLRLKHDIDGVLFTGTVNPSALDKAQHQLLAAKDALLAAQKAVKEARSDVAASVRRTSEAVRAWREQAIKVEKFGTLLQGSRDAHNAEAISREEMEQEDVFRKRA
jgi:hypothetical protein